jgi:alpha-glucosidase (family GH31 glycosyl hydrolase)
MTPLYVRAGAVLPIGPIKQYVDEVVAGPLRLVVFPGADGTTSVYEDDGRTFDYRKGQFMRIAVAWRDAGRRLTLTLAPGSRMLPPGTRDLEVVLAGQTAGTGVLFNGKAVEVRL